MRKFCGKIERLREDSLGDFLTNRAFDVGFSYLTGYPVGTALKGGTGVDLARMILPEFSTIPSRIISPYLKGINRNRRKRGIQNRDYYSDYYSDYYPENYYESWRIINRAKLKEFRLDPLSRDFEQQTQLPQSSPQSSKRKFRKENITPEEMRSMQAGFYLPEERDIYRLRLEKAKRLRLFREMLKKNEKQLLGKTSPENVQIRNVMARQLTQGVMDVDPLYQEVAKTNPELLGVKKLAQRVQAKAPTAAIPEKMPTLGWKKGAALFGGATMLALYNAAKDVSRAAHEQELRSINMMSDRSNVIGRLLEKYVKYKSKEKKFKEPKKFDFLKKSHIKAAKKMSDEEFKKFAQSTADLSKCANVQTVENVPLKYTFFSNDKKHVYGGKTIGMRQKLLSDYYKFGQKLPKGFENFPYENINAMFKKHQRNGWSKRQYKKASFPRKVWIKIMDLIKSLKKSIGIGSQESDVSVGNIIETADFSKIMPSLSTSENVCSFLSGEVTSPLFCKCADCQIICQKIKESQNKMRENAVRETGETSFGQMLRGNSDDNSYGNTTATRKYQKFLKQRMLRKQKKYKKFQYDDNED